MNAKSISVREVEGQLDANAYLCKQQLGTHSSLYYKYLLQQMFQHATATDQRDYDHAICWGQRESLQERDLSAELTTMELIHPDSQHQDFEDLYQDVYQLHRLPGQGRQEVATEDQLCQEVLESIKECIRLKQPPTQPEKQQMQLLANTPQPDPHTTFATANHKMYEEMMALTRGTQQ